jgi:NADH-quinone oxidoreductase subunit N
MPTDALNLAIALLPEIALVAGGCVIVMFLTRKSERAADQRSAAVVAMVSLVVAAVLLQFGPRPTAGGPLALLGESSEGSSSPIVLDHTAWAVRWAALFFGMLLVGGSFALPQPATGTLRISNRGSPEFFMLMLLSLAGLMLVASANDIIVLFLAVELVSLPAVAMVALSRPIHGAIESAGKYFFLGLLAAGLLLMGLVYLFGWTGQTSLLPTHAGGSGGSVVLMVAMGLIVAGLSFSIAAFPFHVYLADVYQGAAAPVAGWLAFVTKAAGFLALAKVLAAVAGPMTVSSPGWHGDPHWPIVIWVLAAATMTAGNVLALWQRSIKRMLAYSSVAHSGYLLVGLLAAPTFATEAGAASTQSLADSVIFYLVAYGLANLGAFLVLAAARVQNKNGGGRREADSYADLAGLARRNLPLAIAMAVFGFSLMGLPPTVGFMAKVFIFVGAYQSGYVVLVVFALVNAAIGVAYYLRMIAACWLGEKSAGETVSPVPPRDPAAPPGVVIVILAVATIAFGLFPALLERPIARQAQMHQPAGRMESENPNPTGMTPTTPPPAGH